MRWIIDLLIFIGVVAMPAGLLVSVAKDSKLAGTTAWWWKNILLLTAGLAFFMLGFMGLWSFLQHQPVRDLIMSVLAFSIGFHITWDSIHELRQTKRSPEKKVLMSLIYETVFTISMASLLVLQYRNYGSVSFTYSILTIVGIGTSIFSIIKVKQKKPGLIEP